jgi:hypothetical protein
MRPFSEKRSRMGMVRLLQNEGDQLLLRMHMKVVEDNASFAEWNVHWSTFRGYHHERGRDLC